MKEAPIVRQITEYLKLAFPAAWVRKLADRHTRGLPDLLAIVPGEELWVFLIEVKRPGGRRRPLQEVEEKRINAMRPGRGRVVWIFAESADDVRESLHVLYGIE